MTLSCPSCLYSGERNGELWCAKWAKPAREKCAGFCYAPGTDERERAASDEAAE